MSFLYSLTTIWNYLALLIIFHGQNNDIYFGLKQSNIKLALFSYLLSLYTVLQQKVFHFFAQYRLNIQKQKHEPGL